MAIFYSKESFLVAYQLLIGFSIIALLASGFLYGVAQTDLEKYRRRLSRWAFGCMMFAAFLSSLVLVPTLFSAMMIPGVSRDLPVMIAALTYLGIGLGITIWFCSSKL
jgi:drug/metabolite transporter (DMT)-like permease